MVLPPNAKVWTQEMDPADVIDYQATLSGVDGLLETGEQIGTFTLTMSPEGAALGVTISAGGVGEGGAAPALFDPLGGSSNTAVKLWLYVDEEFQADPAFEGSGSSIGITLTVHTNSSPARTRQRTLVVKVAQQ